MLQRDPRARGARGPKVAQERPREEEERRRLGRAVGAVRLLQQLVPPDLRALQRAAQRRRRSAVHVPAVHPLAAREEGANAHDEAPELAAPGVHLAADQAVVLPRGAPSQGDGSRAAGARQAPRQARRRDSPRRGLDHPRGVLGGEEAGYQVQLYARVQGSEVSRVLLVQVQGSSTFPED